MALFADVTELIEAMWTALNTQLGAFQLQKGRWTGPAGLGPWSCTQLTGLVTFLTVGALSVIPEEIHENDQYQQVRCTQIFDSYRHNLRFIRKSLYVLNVMLKMVIITQQ